MDNSTKTRYTRKNKIKTASIATRFEVYPIVEHECGSPQPIHKTEYDDIHIIYEYGFDMHTGQKVTRKKDKFEDEKFIKITPKQITSTHTRNEDEDNQQFYYGFVNENTHLHLKMDLYMSNIYSRISLQAIKFYSQICEQTRNLRQLTLTQVQKNTPLLGYILTGDRSIFVKQEGVNVTKTYKCAKKSSPLYVPQTRECSDKIPILYKNRVQYVHQLTRQTYLWAKKVPCSHSNFDQLISIDTEGAARYRLTPYPVKVETILNTISPEEIVLDNRFSKASLIESGIYSKEQLVQETIKENKLQTIPPQLITPPPAYQCLGNSLSAPIPRAPKIEQHNILFNNHPYETPIPINQPTPYEIPKPSTTSNEQQHLIPTSKLLDIQNPPAIDFDQLKLTANKMHNRSHSLDILKNDQPHTNEVTYFDTHSADTYEI